MDWLKLEWRSFVAESVIGFVAAVDVAFVDEFAADEIVVVACCSLTGIAAGYSVGAVVEIGDVDFVGALFVDSDPIF